MTMAHNVLWFQALNQSFVGDQPFSSSELVLSC